MSAPIAFVDCETTGLDPARHHVWEIAVIRRRADGVDCEYLWQIRPDLTTAEPEALKIGRYEERFAVPDGWEAIEVMASGPLFRSTLPEVLFDLQDALKDAVIVGSNPGFDVAFLTALLRAHGRKLPWHYRPVDIATLAAGRKLGMVALVRQSGAKPLPSDEVSFPFSSRALSRAVGVEPPGEGVAHTALGDARWARDVFDAVTGGAS